MLNNLAAIKQALSAIKTAKVAANPMFKLEKVVDGLSFQLSLPWKLIKFKKKKLKTFVSLPRKNICNLRIYAFFQIKNNFI